MPAVWPWCWQRQLSCLFCPSLSPLISHKGPQWQFFHSGHTWKRSAWLTWGEWDTQFGLMKTAVSDRSQQYLEGENLCTSFQLFCVKSLLVIHFKCSKNNKIKMLYTTFQKFGAVRYVLCFWKKHLPLTKVAFNWLKIILLWNKLIFVMSKLNFQHHYSSLQCHMILQK